jgi:dipeptide/tripeptide permease
MELFERFAFYGVLPLLGIYIVDQLGYGADRFGVVYSAFTGAIYLLPIGAGAIADRFGYKPALVVAFATLTAGYYLLGAFTSFWLICLALGLIAIGGSIVKTTVTGTVTRTTEEGSTRPVGFGLYYTTVNVGALCGPVIAAQVRNRTEFHYVFWVSAAACALMFVQALVAYREPVSEEERRAGKSWGQMAAEVVMVLGNWRFVLLLVIFSGFWGMINVLLGFVPLYIGTFSDLPAAEAAIDRVVPLTRWAGHWLNPEVFVALDPLLIVLFQGLVSYLTRRWRTISAMFLGTSVATLAWIFPILSPAAGIVVVWISVWALGEMTCSARFFEYCGTVAPKDQVAVYLGYSFLSLFIGNMYSGLWAGWLYQRFVQGPLDAGGVPEPTWFFGGVMVMGICSAAGLALYARFVAPGKEE